MARIGTGDKFQGPQAPASAERPGAPRRLQVTYLAVALQGHREGEEGDRDPVLARQPLDPPHAGARAVLEDGFGAEVAVFRVHRVDHFGQPVVAPVAVRMGVLRPFFVVQHEADRDPRTVGPARAGDAPAVADEIARGAGNRRPLEWPEGHGRSPALALGGEWGAAASRPTR